MEIGFDKGQAFPKVISYCETSDGKRFDNFDKANEHQQGLWREEATQLRQAKLEAEFRQFYEKSKIKNHTDTFKDFLKEVAKTWQKIPNMED